MSQKSQKNRSTALCQRQTRLHRLFQHQSFFRHAWDALRSAPLYAHWKRVLSYVRRARLVALFVRIFGALLTVLETGALVLLVTAALLLLLPPLIFFALGVLLTVLIEAPRKSRRILEETAQKRIYVLFLPEGESAFFRANARELAAREDAAVVIVSPFWVSSRGIRDGRFFCTARKEGVRIYLVRRYYFFSLKRKVLAQRDTAILY